MNGRDHTLAVALCVSLVAHAATLLILAGQAPSSVQALPPLTGRMESGPIFVPHVPRPEEVAFGDQHGSGDAANSSPGDEPMLGRDAGQSQAFLSRDPVGAGKVGDDPSMSVMPPGQPAPSAASPPPTPAPQAPASPPLIGVSESGALPAPPRVRRTTPVAKQAPPRPPAPPSPETAATAKEQPPAPPAPDALASAAPNGAAAPAADPAIMSDSESDPFAKGESVEFHDGRVDVRFGRKVKTVRPKLSLAAQYDLLAMQFPHMTVRVHIDDAGSPRRVDIVKSSGSEAADQAVKVAMYQWWFEPPKSKGGAALADVVDLPICWR